MMKLGIKSTIIISSLLIILGSSLACSGTNPANGGPLSPAVASPSASGAIKVTNLAVNPDEVNAGVQALITARVTNTGNTDARYQGNIRIDDTAKSSLPSFLPSNEVKISAGETQLLSVTTTINSPGIYKVTWDGVTRTLKVNPEDTTTAVNSPNSAPIPAPDFTAVDVVTGKTVSLKQYSGSAILLNFVNYGCNPALNQKVGDQLLAIRDLTKQRADFTPISVFCGCCPPEVLRQFAKANNLNWPWILDSDYTIAGKYGKYLTQYGYPTLIFIDKDQFITEIAGYTDLSTLNDKLNVIAPAAVK